MKTWLPFGAEAYRKSGTVEFTTYKQQQCVYVKHLPGNDRWNHIGPLYTPHDYRPPQDKKDVALGVLIEECFVVIPLAYDLSKKNSWLFLWQRHGHNNWEDEASAQHSIQIRNRRGTIVEYTRIVGLDKEITKSSDLKNLTTDSKTFGSPPPIGVETEYRIRTFTGKENGMTAIWRRVQGEENFTLVNSAGGINYFPSLGKPETGPQNSTIGFYTDPKYAKNAYHAAVYLRPAWGWSHKVFTFNPLTFFGG